MTKIYKFIDDVQAWAFVWILVPTTFFGIPIAGFCEYLGVNLPFTIQDCATIGVGSILIPIILKIPLIPWMPEDRF